MEQHRVVPFYQAYHMPPYPMPYMPIYAVNGNGGLPLYMTQEMDTKEDLQYLQEMFPEMSRRYAARIASVVDRLDYKGSMIYDEYIDRLRLQRLAHDILQMIEKEEADGAAGGANMWEPAAGGTTQEPLAGERMQNTADLQQRTAGSRDDGAMRLSPRDTDYRQELIYVLLCYEIAKRRHGAGMDLSKFYGMGDMGV